LVAFVPLSDLGVYGHATTVTKKVVEELIFIAFFRYRFNGVVAE
jgi:hypothetical protein